MTKQSQVMFKASRKQHSNDLNDRTFNILELNKCLKLKANENDTELKENARIILQIYRNQIYEEIEALEKLIQSTME